MVSFVLFSMTSFLTNIVSALIIFFIVRTSSADVSFRNNYEPLWGDNHLSIINGGTEATLLLDQSGGAGFRSKLQYQSGLFEIKMKLPNQKTGGVITSFYLTSHADDAPPGIHDEIDFEFIGTEGKLQTNVFANDWGFREQTFQLPLDPSVDFRTFRILYNPSQIVFFIEALPIREYINLNGKASVNYPASAMQIEASIWYSNSTAWAGDIDWSLAPFIVHYQEFDISGCSPGAGIDCSSTINHPWNNLTALSDEQRQQMNTFRNNFMTFDYCAQPATHFPECSFNHA